MTTREQAGGPLDEFLPPVQAPPGGGPSTRFRPWHHRRKQLVRKEQWASGLRELAQGLPPGQPIKYLGLPGEDLLDLELIAGVCRELGRSLGYLGFDETLDPDSTSRQLAEHIVRNMVDVLPESNIVGHSFASIASDTSPAQMVFRNGGPFDVVNLDLCTALTSQPPPIGYMHDALAELVRFQRNKRTEPWLLYVTLRAEADRMKPVEIAKYGELLFRNCEASREFSNALLPIAGLTTAEIPQRFVIAMQGDTWISGRLTAIALGKWLAHLLEGGGTPWRVRMQSLWGYRTGLFDADGKKRAAGSPNMMSVVFRFERYTERVADHHGLATSFAPSRSVDSADVAELMQAVAMATHVNAAARDLDRFLRKNPALEAMLESEAQIALVVRNYDAAGYRAYMAKAASVAEE